MNQIVDQPGDDLKKVVDLPEGIEQEVKTERHVEDDGTVVTTVVTTSRYSGKGHLCAKSHRKKCETRGVY